ncbi:hypothetical protein DICPUDRAFT_151728 [Dictyostelium purpureum]|uniref:Tc1-like transposase DDE domain-containing protein n=1 Tax=Dictyostelium purpureum TaxID=5786 RepID=F0ZJM4_DICPU|nr:uncharacterized protein DICPUDRAFT_151728 [Dictyostelium purpureum]XP_003293394.1 uncharacterized protein DICPUDRAFT_158235 [Dictyostelium purpureum]XP_003294554.1 uncharacterized protein DICPUDRAFT_159572 [Dictyostelium purpureum]EGC28920.1 hypothetical protein DICPUDRAFT_159572 [Dictyostelium purpureum]EGC30083.1 hypothetical protein DICPUDRAFT_158235 [Dictyostelium purpureum]EGC35871.1 hypothetical protein DICPUDRAFT_151728 [Dictyostelium purpureum]|eukprot:XP_003287602.1 hypothetical protein DICPUDRAFT_151728 [Dictyostelium purpureum]
MDSGQYMKEENILKRKRPSVISKFFWGCITLHEFGCGAYINGNMDGDTYINVMGDEYMETLKDYEIDFFKVTLFQDNCSVHKSAAVKK